MKKLNVLKMENLHSRCLVLLLLLFFVSSSLSAQDKIIGTLKNKVTMYVNPNSKSQGIGILPSGGHVTVLSTNAKGWSKVEFIANENGKPVKYSGWILSSSYNKSTQEDYTKYPKVEGLYVTEERSSIGCENISPKYDYDHDCSLMVNARNANYDTVLKLCRDYDDECIRMVYVRGGTSYEIKHIPTGMYYIKMASGEDMRKRTDKYGNCMIVFAENGSYEKTTTKFEFYRESTYEGYSDVGWEFELQARSRSDENRVNSRNISLEEFNR